MIGSGVSESYLYDESGQRIRKKNLLNVRTSSASPTLLYGDGVDSTMTGA